MHPVDSELSEQHPFSGLSSLETLSFLAIATDNEGIIRYVNQTACRWLKRSAEELLGSLPETFHRASEVPAVASGLPQPIDADTGIFEALAKSESTQPIPWSFSDADGHTLMALLSFSELKNATGECYGLLALATPSVDFEQQLLEHRITQARTHAQQQVLIQLHQKLQHTEKIEDQLMEVLRTIVECVGADKGSLWQLKDEIKAVRRCRFNPRHVSGLADEYTIEDFPNYVALLDCGQPIASTSPATDPRLAELAENHALRGVEAVLDVPIQMGKRMCGLLSLECLDVRERWYHDEITFVRIAGEMIARILLEEQRSQVVRALAASQERYQQIFKYAPLGILHYDRDGILLDCNSKFVELVGRTHASLVGMNMPKELQDPQMLEAIYAALHQGMGRYEGIYRSITSGRSRPVRGILSSVHDENGVIIGGVGLFEDVSEQHYARQAIRESEASYRGIFDNAGDAILIQDRRGQFLNVNRAAAVLFGYSVEVLIGRDLSSLAAPGKNDPEAVDASIAAAWAAHPQKLEFWGKRKNGDFFPSEISLSQGQYLGQDVIILFAEDITERRSHEAQIQRLANQDSLTGLPNRRLLIERTEHLIKSAHRQPHGLAMLYLDLDRFKDVNDTLGHDSGDRLLIQVGNLFLRCLRDSDTLARLGGDEFAILLDGADEAEASRVALRVLEALQQPIALDDGNVHVGASIGIALYPRDGDSFRKLFRHADIAMYRAKRDKLGLVFFQKRHSEEIKRRVSLEKELVDAIRNNELVLHFQPRVALSDGHVVSVEALVRWQHPQRGLIYPDQFIPVAESSGSIHQLGGWVLTQAAKTARRWRECNIALPIAVNLSVQELQRVDLADRIREQLSYYALVPGQLELEITETAIMSDVHQSISTVKRLKQLGVQLSIDDFGTGYSSMSYLKRLDADFLKIDRSFVVDLAEDPECSPHDASIIRAVTALGQSLGMQIIAEGVETRGQAQFLRSVGVEQAQGYFFCQPQPEPMLLDYLARTGA